MRSSKTTDYTPWRVLPLSGEISCEMYNQGVALVLGFQSKGVAREVARVRWGATTFPSVPGGVFFAFAAVVFASAKDFLQDTPEKKLDLGLGCVQRVWKFCSPAVPLVPGSWPRFSHFVWGTLLAFLGRRLRPIGAASQKELVPFLGGGNVAEACAEGIQAIEQDSGPHRFRH